jgi:hypothetical protein
MPDALPNPPQIIVTSPMPKPAYQSKIILINAAVMALATLETQLHILQPLLPVNIYMLLTLALPPVNMVLRAWFTSRPIGSAAQGLADRAEPPWPDQIAPPPPSVLLTNLSVQGAEQVALDEMRKRLPGAL